LFFLLWERIEGDCKFFFTLIEVDVEGVVNGADVELLDKKLCCGVYLLKMMKSEQNTL